MATIIVRLLPAGAVFAVVFVLIGVVGNEKQSRRGESLVSIPSPHGEAEHDYDQDSRSNPRQQTREISSPLSMDELHAVREIADVRSGRPSLLAGSILEGSQLESSSSAQQFADALKDVTISQRPLEMNSTSLRTNDSAAMNNEASKDSPPLHSKETSIADTDLVKTLRHAAELLNQRAKETEDSGNKDAADRYRMLALKLRLEAFGIRGTDSK